MLRNVSLVAIGFFFFAAVGCATSAPEEATSGEDALVTTISMTCTSTHARFQECRPGTPRGRIVDVTLTRQRGAAPCTQGATWGWDADRIWVDKDCRGAFAVAIAQNEPPPPPPGSTPVKLFRFPSCDDFWLLATLTPETNCDAITESVSAVEENGECKLIGPSNGRDTCYAHRPE